MLQKYSMIPELFYFPLLPVAKFANECQPTCLTNFKKKTLVTSSEMEYNVVIILLTCN